MRRLFVLGLLLAACAHAKESAPRATMDSAEHAFSASDYETARRLYAALASDESLSAKDREKTQITLANIEWRIDSNPTAARTRLEALGTHKALLEESRMERESRRWTEAVALARKALALAANAEEQRNARTSLA